MAFGANSVMNGILLVKTHVAFSADATLNGAVYAQTACTLISNTINGTVNDYECKNVATEEEPSTVE
jgi:hypothetical protein